LLAEDFLALTIRDILGFSFGIYIIFSYFSISFLLFLSCSEIYSYSVFVLSTFTFSI